MQHFAGLYLGTTRATDGVSFLSGSQEARVAKGGTVGAAGGVHNPSNTLPAGMWTPWALKAIQVLGGSCKSVGLMCLLSRPSPSRRPSGEPARCPKERTDKLFSSGYVPLNPFIASPIFITAIVALRGRERTAAGRHFLFRDDNEDSPWGSNHRLKKTGFRAQCWPQGETCKVWMDSLCTTCALSIGDGIRVLIFLQNASVFFLR